MCHNTTNINRSLTPPPHHTQPFNNEMYVMVINPLHKFPIFKYELKLNIILCIYQM